MAAEYRLQQEGIEQEAPILQAKAVELADNESITFDEFFAELNAVAPNTDLKNFGNLSARIFRADGFIIRMTYDVKEISERARTGISYLMRNIDERAHHQKNATPDEVRKERVALHDGIGEMLSAAGEHEEMWKEMLAGAQKEARMRSVIMQTEKPDGLIVGNNQLWETRETDETKAVLLTCAKILLKNGFQLKEDLM